MNPAPSQAFAIEGTAPTIHIADFTPRETRSLRGFCMVSIEPGILIHGCAVFEKDGQRWVKFPQREYKNRNGATQYAPIISFVSPKLERAVQQATLDALDRFLEEDGHAG